MPTLEQKKQIISDINTKIENIISTDIESELVRQQVLGQELNFAQARNTFLRANEYCNKVKNADLDAVPYSQLANFNNNLSTFHNTFSTIKNFSSTTNNNPNFARTSLINQINEQLDILIEYALPILLADSVLNSKESQTKAQMTELLNDLQNQKDNILKEAEAQNDELKSILESAKRAAGDVGVAQHSNLFKSESNNHSKIANKWLVATIVLLIFTATMSVIILFIIPTKDNTNAYLIQFTITKIVFLITLFYALSISIKNFRAHKHNEILNKHRQNALTTFETFIKASSDEQTKNAVLLQTTQSIFANQQTGYSSNDNDMEMPSKIVEIIKSVNPK